MSEVSETFSRHPRAGRELPTVPAATSAWTGTGAAGPEPGRTSGKRLTVQRQLRRLHPRHALHRSSPRHSPAQQQQQQQGIEGSDIRTRTWVSLTGLYGQGAECGLRIGVLS